VGKDFSFWILSFLPSPGPLFLPSPLHSPRWSLDMASGVGRLSLARLGALDPWGGHCYSPSLDSPSGEWASKACQRW
jgi:hypothetical protein